MKEATGELNMTLVVVIAVGVLAAFFFAILWPSIKNSMIMNSKCSDAVCNASTVSNGKVTCSYYKNGVKQGSDFECVWKG
jgi:hypothetical protein